MEQSVYDNMAASEDGHWWYVGRRALVERLIVRYIVNPATERDSGRAAPLQILEAGCGSGGNLSMLSRYGAVDAFEYSAEARAIATQRGVAKVTEGMLPATIRQPDNHYDLIGLFDVLEHIDDDTATLQALKRKMKADGWLILTVPALPWLWTKRDVCHEHKRRYTKDSLAAVIASADLQCVRLGYFNSLLFPLGAVHRLLLRLTDSGLDDESTPPPLLNFILKQIFCSERYYIPRLGFPIGLSLYAVVRL